MAVAEPPACYVNRRRLKAAALLRDNELPVVAVACWVEFCGGQHLATRFCARYGLNPRAYRER